jgi:hypothetical protein
LKVVEAIFFYASQSGLGTLPNATLKEIQPEPYNALVFPCDRAPEYTGSRVSERKFSLENVQGPTFPHGSL